VPSMMRPTMRLTMPLTVSLSGRPAVAPTVAIQLPELHHMSVTKPLISN
jgi:hypothetical protein